jgi:hypothetical protein
MIRRVVAADVLIGRLGISAASDGGSYNAGEL